MFMIWRKFFFLNEYFPELSNVENYEHRRLKNENWASAWYANVKELCRFMQPLFADLSNWGGPLNNVRKDISTIERVEKTDHISGSITCPTLPSPPRLIFHLLNQNFKTNVLAPKTSTIRFLGAQNSKTIVLHPKLPQVRFGCTKLQD